MSKRIVVALGLCLAFCGPQSAQQFYVAPAVAPGVVPFQSAAVWNGGLTAKQEWTLNTGIQWAISDGPNVAYIRGNDSAWHNLLTDIGFRSTAACDSPGYNTIGTCWGFVTAGNVQTMQDTTLGGVDICGAPTNASRAWLLTGNGSSTAPQGGVYRADNVSTASPDAITWINVNQLSHSVAFPLLGDLTNDAQRVDGRYIACDPNNANAVWVSTQKLGVWYTSNAGMSWTQVSGSDVPINVTGTAPHAAILAIDPQSGTNGSGVTNTVCIYTFNGSKLYCSFTGGGPGTWVAASGAGAPSSANPIRMMEFSKFGTGHALWAVVANVGLASVVVDTAGNLPTNPWNVRVAGTGQWVALDTVGNAIFVNGLGTVISGTYASNGTATMGSTSGMVWPAAAGDTPWVSSNAVSHNGVTYSVVLDPAGSGKASVSAAQSIWTATLPFPNGGNINWLPNNKGIMHLVGRTLDVPSYGNVLTGYEDIGGCTVSLTSVPIVGPSVCNYSSQSKGLTFVSGIAHAANSPTTAFARIGGDGGVDSDFTGSAPAGDYYRSSATPFNKWFAQVPSANIINNGGNVQISLVGTPYTTTGLVPWGAPPWTHPIGSVICAFATPTNLFSGSPDMKTEPSCTEVVSVPNSTTINTLWLYSATQNTATVVYTIYQRTMSSLRMQLQNVTGVSVGASNTIQIQTVEDSAGANEVNEYVNIQGINCSSGTAPNGEWTILSTGTNTFILEGSDGVTSPCVYTGGGTVRHAVESAGNIAASTTQNIVVAPGGGIPQCTLDGGKTWTDVPSTAFSPANVTNGPYAAGAAIITIDNPAFIPPVGTSGRFWLPLSDGRLLSAIPDSPVMTTNSTVTSGTNTLHFAAPMSNWVGQGAWTVTDSGGAIPGGTTVAGANVAAGTITLSQPLVANSNSGDSITFGGFPANAILMDSSTGHRIGAVPPGATVANGPFYYPGTGMTDPWGWAQGWTVNATMLDSDKVAANTFFYINLNYGLMKQTLCNAPIVLNNDVVGGVGWNLGSNQSIKMVPGESGHGFISPGKQGGAFTNNTKQLFRFCNGDTNTPGAASVVPVAVDGFFGAIHMGYGAPKPGGSGYPSLYIYGWYDNTHVPGAKTQAGSLVGGYHLWESNDDPNHGNSGAGATCLTGNMSDPNVSMNSGSWHKVTIGGVDVDFPSIFPGGPKVMFAPVEVSGAPDSYGPLYMMTNQGLFYAKIQ